MEQQPNIRSATPFPTGSGQRSSLWKEVGRRFIKKKMALFGLIVLIIVFLFSFVGPFFLLIRQLGRIRRRFIRPLAFLIG